MSVARGSPGQPSRLIVVDDHELARGGLRSMLSGEPDLELVGEAEDGEQAIALVARLRPDLVLMDVRMPGMDGIAATRAIKADFPGTSILIITLYLDHEYLFQAVKAGAAGYVLKDASRRELLASIRAVLSGEAALDPAVTRRLLSRIANEARAHERMTVEPLTRREIDVLGLIIQGQTNQEISRALGIGVGTVKTHVEHIIAKLGVVDRTQAAVRAIQLGVLSWNPENHGRLGGPQVRGSS